MLCKLRDSVVQQTYNKLNIYFPFPPTVVIFTISKFASIRAKKTKKNRKIKLFVNCNKNLYKSWSYCCRSCCLPPSYLD